MTAAATPMAAEVAPANVLVVGVGGQGVVLISKILARLAQRHGFDVKQSEVHGMAKRGGSVFSHVRFAPTVWAPTIPLGEADVVVALEWAEGLRWLGHLRPGGGTLIVDTKRIVPPFGCSNRRRGASLGYPHASLAEVAAVVPDTFALDAEGMAAARGNPRAANTVLLGVLSTVIPFELEQWHAVLREFVPASSVEANLAAFADGRAWALAVHEASPAQLAPSAPHADVTDHVRLEIVRAWCKGCDICVKMCPELCLRLDHDQRVVLSDPAACTGCHVCEWLCPDFALTVHFDGAA